MHEELKKNFDAQGDRISNEACDEQQEKDFVEEIECVRGISIRRIKTVIEKTEVFVLVGLKSHFQMVSLIGKCCGDK